MFPLAPDDTPYRLVTTDGVSTFDTPAGRFLKVEPEAITALTAAAMRDIAHFLRPDHLAQLRKVLDDPEASDNDRFVALDLLKNAAISAGGVLPMCQDTGTAIVKAQEGPVRVHRRRRRGGDRRGCAAHLRDEQPALQPDGAADDVRGAQHRHQPAGRDQDLRRRRRHVLVPLHRQGRRQRQQVVPLPGDQGAAQRGDAAAVDLREDADAGHRRLPAVPPRRRDRRHVGGVRRGDRQAGVDALPRHAADRGLDGGSRLPRRRAGGQGAAARPADRHRRAVRRQVLLPRRAHRPPAPPRRQLPGGDGRVVLGRPSGEGQDHPRRRVPRAAGDRSGALPAPRSPISSTPRRPCTSTSTRPMAEILAELSRYPGEDAGDAHRADGRRPRHRPRQDQGAPRRRRADARLPPRPLRVLRRPGQDAGGLRVGVVRPDDRRADGQLRRAVPGRRRVDGHARQGQPLAAGHRRLRRPRRLLPRLDRRPGGPPGPRQHQEGRGARVPGAGDGSGVAASRSSTSRRSSSSTTRATTSSSRSAATPHPWHSAAEPKRPSTGGVAACARARVAASDSTPRRMCVTTRCSLAGQLAGAASGDGRAGALGHEHVLDQPCRSTTAGNANRWSPELGIRRQSRRRTGRSSRPRARLPSTR